MKLLLRLLGNALALYAAAWFVPGIYVDSSGWLVWIVMGLVLGLINAIIRPVLKLLTCPLIIVTLGLFTLVINALTLQLAFWLGQQLGLGFYVDGFWPAFWGALIISVVSFVLNLLLKDEAEEKVVYHQRG